MHPDRFAELAKEFLDKVEDLSASKSKEYASVDDKLRNFKDVGAFLNMTPEEVCLTYTAKHSQALINSIREGTTSWCWTKEDGSEGTKQRILDVILYHLCLAGLLDEAAENRLKSEVRLMDDSSNMPDRGLDKKSTGHKLSLPKFASATKDKPRPNAGTSSVKRSG